MATTRVKYGLKENQTQRKIRHKGKSDTKEGAVVKLEKKRNGETIRDRKPHPKY